MGRTPYYCSLPTWLSLTWQTGLITIYGCEKPSFPLGFLRCYPVGSDGVPYCWSQFTSIRSLSLVQLFVTPWTVACQASLPITSSQSLLKLMSIEWVMPSKHLILCLPLLLPPSIFPSIKIFSSESVICIKWPKCWNFNVSITPSNEHSGLISFGMDLWSKAKLKVEASHIVYTDTTLDWDSAQLGNLWIFISSFPSRTNEGMGDACKTLQEENVNFCFAFARGNGDVFYNFWSGVWLPLPESFLFSQASSFLGPSDRKSKIYIFSFFPSSLCILMFLDY